MSFSTLGANMLASSGSVRLYNSLFTFQQYTAPTPAFSKSDIFASSVQFLDQFWTDRTLHRLRRLNDYLFFLPAGGDACQLFTKSNWQVFWAAIAQIHWKAFRIPCMTFAEPILKSGTMSWFILFFIFYLFTHYKFIRMYSNYWQILMQAFHSLRKVNH
jgi:hypothetical protein